MNYTQSKGKWIKASDYMPPVNSGRLYLFEFSYVGTLDDRFWCKCSSGCRVELKWQTVDFTHPLFDLHCYPVLCNGSLKANILCEDHHDISEEITKANVHYYISHIDIYKASLSENLVAWLRIEDLETFGE